MKKITSLIRQHKLLLLFATIFLLMLWISSLPAGTQAQGDPLPTPTNLGEGGDQGGGDDDDDDNGGEAAPPGSPRAGLSGFVYGYSDGGFVGGVTVLFKSPGWQAEMVTDSNGYFQFRGLDSGTGVLNLRLPPGATSVTKDWPVRLVSGQETQVNLGFYWGNNPPIPVRLSASATGGQLLVRVENRTGDAATGGLIQIEPVEGVKVSLPVEASHGEVVDYSAYDFQVDLPEVDAGETATVQVQLEPTGDNFQAGRDAGLVRVLFTYDQQITPQVVEVDLTASDLSVPLAEAGVPQAVQPAAAGQETGQEFAPPAAPSTPQAQSQPVPGAAAQATSAAPAVSETETQAQPTVATETGQPLPTTGEVRKPVTSLTTVLLAGLLVLGLSWTGWKSLRRPDPEG
jgi:hypothetical protein